MTFLEQIKNHGGKAKFSSRAKRMNPDSSHPKWTAFISVFGQDTAGDEATKEEAVIAALLGMPAHLRRHFHL